MKKPLYAILIVLIIFSGCDKEKEVIILDNQIPLVKADSSYNIIKEEDVIYANGLSHNESSTAPFSIPLKLDIYYPNNNSANRPVYMFIHGGGFTGGIKHKPEIIDMQKLLCSRGWVFVSIDYRTTEELGVIQGMTPEELIVYYRGITQEWIENVCREAKVGLKFNKLHCLYLSKGIKSMLLRWIVKTQHLQHKQRFYYSWWKLRSLSLQLLWVFQIKKTLETKYLY